MFKLILIAVIVATASAGTVQWTLDPRTPRGAQSCDTVCADVSKTCDQSSLDNLNNDAAFTAAFDAWKPGHCKKWHTGCARGNNCARWGSPFIHSSHLKDNLCWKGSPVAACGQRPVDGHHRRLCPCAASKSTPGCKNKKERHITGTFHYFNSGSATGCEHRHHYLYEYHGSDCIWTSSPTAIRDLGKYTYESMRVEFKVADYGKMEYSDYVKVEMAPCLNGKCERFYQTELIRADTKGNLGRRSINDRYHGWYWQTIKQAKGGKANWMDQLDKHHNQIRIRITLKSDDNYNERHILDNLEIKGMACDKVVEKVVKCKTTTCAYSGGHTHVYSKMLNDNGSKNTAHERWTCAKTGSAADKTFNNPTVNIAKFEKKLGGSGDQKKHESMYISKSGKRKRASPNDNASYSLCAGSNAKGETKFGDDHTNNGHFADRFCSYHGYTGGHVSFKIANNGKNDCTVYHNNGTGRRYDNKHDYKLSQIVCAGQAACGCMCHSKYSCTLTHHHTSGYKRAFNHC